jgi:hypothetical protein
VNRLKKRNEREEAADALTYLKIQKMRETVNKEAEVPVQLDGLPFELLYYIGIRWYTCTKSDVDCWENGLSAVEELPSFF